MCKARLGKNFYPAVVRPDGTLLSKEQVKAMPAASLACACSGRGFIYHPFPGSIRYNGEVFGSIVLYRMIAWCPQPCHEGRRVVLLENGAVHVLSESAFQSAVANDYRCENRSVLD